MKIVKLTEINMEQNKTKAIYINLDQVTVMQERYVQDEREFAGTYTNITLLDGTYKNVIESAKKIIELASSSNKASFPVRTVY